MDRPPVSYLERDGTRLAYQVIGDGPSCVVWLLEISNHLDLYWTDPHIHHLFERSAGYSRSLFTQRRGFGVGDPVVGVPSAQEQADDVVALMDAAGFERATVVALMATCPVAITLAAQCPERVSSLVLANPIVQGSRCRSELLGWTRAQAQAYARDYLDAADAWGEGHLLPLWERALDSRYNRVLMSMMERCSASRSAAQEYFRWTTTVDVRHLLPLVTCPVWILRTPTGSYPQQVAEAVAAALPHATVRVLPVPAPGSSLGEGWIPLFDEVQQAVTGAPRPQHADRLPSAVLFTDVVGSTELLTFIGDSAYRDLIEKHHRQVRHAVEQSGGVLVSTAGDGTLSVYDNPAQAVRCGEAVQRAAATIGLAVRAGVHSGQVERTATEIKGITVHIAARVSSLAQAGELLVTAEVYSALGDSGRTFTARGTHRLKGVTGAWELSRLDPPAGPPASATPPHGVTVLDRAVLSLARRNPAAVRRVLSGTNAVQRLAAHIKMPAQ